MARLCRNLCLGALFAGTRTVNSTNAKNLHVAWRWKSPDMALKEANPGLAPSRANKSTPLMVAGVLYTSTSLSEVAAIDAVSGETKWVFDPKVYDNGLGIPANNGWLHRGVAYWRNGDDERIVILTAFGQMIALDAKTGKPVPTFGSNGRVDLAEGLRRPVDRDYYTMTSPPVIVRGVIVTGSSVMDWWAHRPSPVGDVRGFDVVTGRLLWTFHTVAQQGEPGVETWEKNSWKQAGNTNVWAPMSADEELGYVYLPVSTPTNDYYGGDRPGDGLYGESLVCLDAVNGKMVWHYQMVHHGLWDYDPGRAQPDRHHRRRQTRQGGGASDKTGFCLCVRSRHRKAGLADQGKAGAGSSVPGEHAPRRPSRFRAGPRRSTFRACAKRI